MLAVVFVLTMKREQIRRMASIVLLGGTALSALAATGENPYLVIVQRNPFALRSAVPVMPPAPEVPPRPSTPLIWLTCITDLPGQRTAMFQYEDRQTHKVRYSTLLTEGQGDETVAVLEIDPVNALVRVKCGETEATLDFVRHGLKPGVSLVAAAPPVPPPFRAAPPNPSDRVVIGNQPAWTPAPPAVLKPALTREQVEALIEQRRTELRALETSGQSGPGRGSSAILPPTRLGTGGAVRP